MARYFFHLLNGSEHILDPTGVELATLDDVATVSLREVRALIAADALDGHINLGQRLEVRDSAGRCAHALDFASAVTITPPPDR